MSKPNYGRVEGAIEDAHAAIIQAREVTESEYSDAETGLHTEGLDRAEEILDCEQEAAHAMTVAITAPYSEIHDTLGGVESALDAGLQQLGETGSVEVVGPVEEHRAIQSKMIEARALIEEARSVTANMADDHDTEPDGLFQRE